MIFEERSDFTFRNLIRPPAAAALRGMAERLGAAIFFFDHRITVFSRARNTEIMTEILREIEAPPIERVVVRASDARSLRGRMAAYRAAFSTELGAAVVCGDTALFYPQKPVPKTQTKIAGERLSFKIDLAGFHKRIQIALASADGRAGFVKLLSYQPSLKGFTFSALSVGVGFSVVAQRGSDELIRITSSASKTLRVRIDLDVTAAAEELASGEWLDALCDLFQAKERSAEVVHAFKIDVNSLSLSQGFWRPNALGPLDLLSELVAGDVELGQGPKVGASV